MYGMGVDGFGISEGAWPVGKGFYSKKGTCRAGTNKLGLNLLQNRHFMTRGGSWGNLVQDKTLVLQRDRRVRRGIDNSRTQSER